MPRGNGSVASEVRFFSLSFSLLRCINVDSTRNTLIIYMLFDKVDRKWNRVWSTFPDWESQARDSHRFARSTRRALKKRDGRGARDDKVDQSFARGFIRALTRGFSRLNDRVFMVRTESRERRKRLVAAVRKAYPELKRFRAETPLVPLLFPRRQPAPSPARSFPALWPRCTAFESRQRA